MKILVIAHYQNRNSVIAPYIRDQIEAYCSLGNQILVVTPIAIGKKDHRNRVFRHALWIEEKEGICHAFIRYLSLSRYGENWFNAFSARTAIAVSLLKTIKDFAPDVIHANTLGFDSEIGAWLKTFFSVPLVVTTHGSDTSVPLTRGKGNLLKKWADHTDTIVCVSTKLKDELLSTGTTADLKVISNGFNGKFLRDERLKKKACSLIQVGNLLPSKKVDMTIRALSIVRKKHPEAALTVVGRGPEKEKLERLCKDLSLSDSVSFTGQVDNQKVFELLSDAEYYVMVSSPEGFGIVYLEAMASKCLVIGAENEGISDLVVSGENGFLLPVDDPNAIAEVLLWAIDHPEEKKTIVQNGYECALKHTWKENAGQYLTLFHGLMND